jgi:hypothetical protein
MIFSGVPSGFCRMKTLKLQGSGESRRGSEISLSSRPVQKHRLVEL